MGVPGIELVKHQDRSVVLRVTRSDGSVDWQKQKATHADFFPLHDLTHYAVESVLAIPDAFFGLVAAGWSIEDTTGKGTRGPLPLNALFVEVIVGVLDTERASQMRWTATEFNESLATHMARRASRAPRLLTDAELALIRKRRAELFEQWREVPLGQTLALPLLSVGPSMTFRG